MPTNPALVRWSTLPRAENVGSQLHSLRQRSILNPFSAWLSDRWQANNAGILRLWALTPYRTLRWPHFEPLTCRNSAKRAASDHQF